MCHENGFVCGFNAAVGLSGKEKCGQLNEKNMLYWTIFILQRLGRVITATGHRFGGWGSILGQE